MSFHAASAVRAYLKASGLPEFDEIKWLEARKLLLGDDAKDPQNAINLTIEQLTPQEHKLQAAVRLLRKPIA